jgi:flagellar basal body L-ring protein FlgH
VAKARKAPVKAKARAKSKVKCKITALVEEVVALGVVVVNQRGRAIT